MSELVVVTPEPGRPDKTEDPKIANAINAIRAWANGNIDTSNLTAAANALIKQGGLTFATRAISSNVNAGERVLFTGGTVATLGAGTIGDVVEIRAGVGVTLEVKGGTFFGDFVSGPEKLVLTALQHVTLVRTGATEWVIVAGEPKHEQAFSAQAEGNSAIPSMTRPAEVLLEVANGGNPYAVNVYVGGVKVGRLAQSSAAPQASMLSFRTNPGEEWKVAEGEGAFTVLHSTRLL